jgi:hypothetical protein
MTPTHVTIINRGSAGFELRLPLVEDLLDLADAFSPFGGPDTATEAEALYTGMSRQAINMIASKAHALGISILEKSAEAAAHAS